MGNAGPTDFRTWRLVVGCSARDRPRRRDACPNSNTFIAHIGRSVPELHLDLPPTAIGKDFMTRNRFLDTPPSGNGTQFSFFGLFGGLISAVEGIEINIFSLSFGLGITPHTIWPLKLRLPLFGIIRLGVNTDTN